MGQRLRTKCLLIGDAGKKHVPQYVASRLPIFAGLAYRNVVKYLGLHLGPGAGSEQWANALRWYTAAVDKVCNFELGKMASIPFYNMLAVSKLAWLAPFAQPDNYKFL